MCVDLVFTLTAVQVGKLYLGATSVLCPYAGTAVVMDSAHVPTCALVPAARSPQPVGPNPASSVTFGV